MRYELLLSDGVNVDVVNQAGLRPGRLPVSLAAAAESRNEELLLNLLANVSLMAYDVRRMR